jgi:hypothetical protein
VPAEEEVANGVAGTLVGTVVRDGVRALEYGSTVL